MTGSSSSNPSSTSKRSKRPRTQNLSDKDRVGAAPELAETPTNELPFALGNSLERVEAEQPSDELDELGQLAQLDPDVSPQARSDQLEGSGEDEETDGDENDESGEGLEVRVRADADARGSWW